MPVYFIRAGDDGPVKIGWANNVEERRSALQTGHHEQLRVIRTVAGNWATERWLQDRFEAQQIRAEWFHYHADMATIEPPEIDAPIPWRAARKRPEKRVGWEMCWRGNPCRECQVYGVYA